MEVNAVYQHSSKYQKKTQWFETSKGRVNDDKLHFWVNYPFKIVEMSKILDY